MLIWRKYDNKTVLLGARIYMHTLARRKCCAPPCATTTRLLPLHRANLDANYMTTSGHDSIGYLRATSWTIRSCSVWHGLSHLHGTSRFCPVTTEAALNCGSQCGIVNASQMRNDDD